MKHANLHKHIVEKLNNGAEWIDALLVLKNSTTAEKTISKEIASSISLFRRRLNKDLRKLEQAHA
jgi:hypothetical protein